MRTSIFFIAFIAFCIFTAALVMFVNCGKKRDAPAGDFTVIPRPLEVKKRAGTFILDKRTVIVHDPGDAHLNRLAAYFCQRIKNAAGFTPRTAAAAPDREQTIISLTLAPDKSLGTEGYYLRVQPGKLTLQAPAANGIFYGIQTILQLLPIEIWGSGAAAGITLEIPAVEIKDAPRYPWRGMHLDVARHFFPKEFVKKYIDYLAMYKFNTFHWHLTEDQGWRIEIEKYPRLTEISAWRKESWGDGKPHGGFFTREEIKEIVAYASERYITIVPEIEMPGHSQAALAAYPELSCTGGPFEVDTRWGIREDIYCAGNEKTFEFLENVLSEVVELFPGEFVHIGGDEAPKARWQKCERCQARMKAEGLEDENQLQAYLIKRIEKFLNARGKRLIGWDEILEGGLAPNAAVMSWRGMEGGIEAAKQNHDVVMTPTSHCYFDYYQGHPDYEPRAIGGYLPVSMVYALEPTPEDLPAHQEKHILGGQGNVWTEYIAEPRHVEYMVFPRMAALGETVWSSPGLRDWNSFQQRLLTHFDRYEKMGVGFARSALFVIPAASFDPQKKKITVTLDTEIDALDIRYTLDGGIPTLESPQYKTPIILDRSASIKAAAFREGATTPSAAVMTYDIQLHKAFAKKVTVTPAPAEWTAAGGEHGFTDGIRGSKNFRDGHWQGFEGQDFEAVIHLDQMTPVSSIAAGFLQKPGSRVFFPTRVEFYLSTGGENFEKIGETRGDPPPDNNEITIKDFAVECSSRTARYVKILAKNPGPCPQWHIAAGQNAWLFVDELIVK
jgi:hexosaminidase